MDLNSTAGHQPESRLTEPCSFERAHVVLGYPAEGIVAHIHLVREVGAWVVTRAEVVEH